MTFLKFTNENSRPFFHIIYRTPQIPFRFFDRVRPGLMGKIKRQRAAELEAKKEAARVAKMEAEARKQEEIAARKKLLIEQQEDERLRQKHIQRKEKLAEQKDKLRSYEEVQRLPTKDCSNLGWTLIHLVCEKCGEKKTQEIHQHH